MEIAIVKEIIFTGKQNIPWNDVEQYLGRLAKSKANAAQVIGEMIEIADNKRWIENKDDKHKKNASRGWYRYDTRFAIPVKESGNGGQHQNIFRGTLIVRGTDHGLYLYDMINIKKEASTPL